MGKQEAITVLFTGYAPVHFVCFQSLYDRLVADERFLVFVSGGVRSKAEAGYLFDEHALYDPFGIPSERMLSVDQIRERDFDVLFAANTKLIEPRQVGKRVQLFHGISFRNRAIRKQNMKCDHYFLAGPYMHRKFIEAGLLEENDPRALKMGFLKTDRLRNGVLDRRELLQRYGFDGARPVLLYAPTGDKSNSMETMGKDVIRRLAESQKYELLIKPHDHPKNTDVDWFEKLATLEDAHTRVVRERDVIPLLFLADLLITDASSVSSEYALMDRPIVFLDVPKLIARVMARNNTMVDMDTWGRRAGIIVKKPERVLDAVDKSLADPSSHAEVRRAMADDLFYNPGRATDEAFDWVCGELAATVRSIPTSSV